MRTNNYNNYNYNYNNFGHNEPNNNKKRLLLIIILVIFLFLVTLTGILLGVFLGGGKGDDHKIDPSVPSPHISTKNVTENEIDIDIKISPDSEDTSISYFDIQVSKKENFNKFDEYKTSGVVETYNITGLNDDTLYYIRSYSVDENQKGSDYSDVIKATTDRISGDGPSYPDISPRPDVYPSDWGYGSGKKWDDKVYAPFVDIVSTPTPDLSYYNQNMGANYFNLGFVNTLQNATGLSDDGTIPWSWGGWPGLSEDDGIEQYTTIKNSIKDYREKCDGDVTVSFGGAAGIPFWMNDYATVDSLEKTYELLINGMGLSRIDFDIEGQGNILEKNVMNAKALKLAQDKTGVQVDLTLPILQTGLTDRDNKILKAYLDEGIDITEVNVMAMCFNSTMGDPGQFDDVIMSIDALQKQIKENWKNIRGENLTDEEAYHLIGVTPSIGFENMQNEPYSPEDEIIVAKYAEEHEVGMMSDWVENRDALEGEYGRTQTSHVDHGGIDTQWEFGLDGRNNFTDENFSKPTPPDPNKITGFKISSKTFNSANITWDDNQPIGIDTRVYFAKQNDDNYELVDSFSSGKGGSYEFDYLEPNQGYWVLLAAVNDNLDRTFSQPINFKTNPLPEDHEPPKWKEGSTIHIDDSLSSYNKVAFDFNQATDNVGVSKYVATLSDDSGTLQTQEFIDGQDFTAKDDIINVSFDGLKLGSSYKLNVNAYDLSGNKSNNLETTYATPSDYPLFDYDKSQDNFYRLNDIVKFTSTDKDWVNAGIGEKLYQKTGTWGGWAPDGTTVGSPGSTDYEPGTTRPGSTAWDHYTTDSHHNEKVNKFTNFKPIIDKNYYLDKRNTFFCQNNVIYKD